MTKRKNESTSVEPDIKKSKHTHADPNVKYLKKSIKHIQSIIDTLPDIKNTSKACIQLKKQLTGDLCVLMKRSLQSGNVSHSSDSDSSDSDSSDSDSSDSDSSDSDSSDSDSDSSSIDSSNTESDESDDESTSFNLLQELKDYDKGIFLQWTLEYLTDFDVLNGLIRVNILNQFYNMKSMQTQKLIKLLAKVRLGSIHRDHCQAQFVRVFGVSDITSLPSNIIEIETSFDQLRDVQNLFPKLRHLHLNKYGHPVKDASSWKLLIPLNLNQLTFGDGLKGTFDLTGSKFDNIHTLDVGDVNICALNVKNLRTLHMYDEIITPFPPIKNLIVTQRNQCNNNRVYDLSLMNLQSVETIQFKKFQQKIKFPVSMPNLSEIRFLTWSDTRLSSIEFPKDFTGLLQLGINFGTSLSTSVYPPVKELICHSKSFPKNLKFQLHKSIERLELPWDLRIFEKVKDKLPPHLKTFKFGNYLFDNLSDKRALKICLLRIEQHISQQQKNEIVSHLKNKKLLLDQLQSYKYYLEGEDEVTNHLEQLQNDINSLM